MIYNIEEVFKNGPTSIEERLEVLDNTIKGIERLRKEVTSQAYYCEKCKCWYNKNDTKLMKTSRIYTVCTNPFNGYLEDYEYEERTDIELWETCPNDHKLYEKPKFIL